MLNFIRRVVLSQARQYRIGFNKHKKFLFILLLLLVSCQSDVMMTSHEETRVIIDSVNQTHEIAELDVLVVLDRSGSMINNETDVGEGISLFRTDIEGLTSQYRFGFITSDSSSLGYMGYYDDSASAIDLLLAPTILPRPAGEACFEASYVFMNSEEGLDFRRPEADFLVFLISDEDEQSAIEADIFYDWLQQEFANVRHDIVSITTIDESTCSLAYDIGYKYIDLATLYGKNAIDICEEDWDAWLADSSFLTRSINSISLSETPVASSIVVYVDRLMTYAWSYDEEANVVYLDFVPDFGALIEVGYEVLVE